MDAKSNQAIEIIPSIINQDRLYWISSDNPPQSSKVAFYFNVDKEMVYIPFFYDFGPLNIAQIHEFSISLNKILNVYFIQDPAYTETKIFHLCSGDPKKKANAALLICCYQV